MSATLCLGEALVDLIAVSPSDSLRAAARFQPHPGGVSANVAVAAARAGGRVALAGGVGADRWGRWLVDRLAAESVDVARLTAREQVATQLAWVTVDASGEPAYTLHEPVGATLAPGLLDELPSAVADASGLFLTSNTLADRADRELTMRARGLALDLGRPVVLDGNLRLSRWSSRTDAMASCNAVVPGALLVRANRAEAELLTGEADPERAALALRKAGAVVAVVTLGADGAVLRGPNRLARRLPAVVPTRLLSTIGAGDALTGTLLAALERSGYYPDAVAAALDDGLVAAARACASLGARD